jgi:ABC-type transporter Mla subunit MlaD
MATFKETSDSLDLALKVVEQKKAALDTATKAMSAASNEYNDAMNKAQGLKQTMLDTLNGVLSFDGDNVKVFRPAS